MIRAKLYAQEYDKSSINGCLIKQEISKKEEYDVNINSLEFFQNGKQYELTTNNLKSVNDFKRNGLVFPLKDKRNFFKITVINDIIFYHDKDIVINKNDQMISNLLKQIELNTSEDSTNNFKKIRIEILTTKIDQDTFKFERLNKHANMSTFSYIGTLNDKKINFNSTNNQDNKLDKLSNLKQLEDIHENKDAKKRINKEASKLKNLILGDASNKSNKDSKYNWSINNWSKWAYRTNASSSGLPRPHLAESEKLKIRNLLISTSSLSLNSKHLEKNETIDKAADSSNNLEPSFEINLASCSSSINKNEAQKSLKKSAKFDQDHENKNFNKDQTELAICKNDKPLIESSRITSSKDLVNASLKRSSSLCSRDDHYNRQILEKIKPFTKRDIKETSTGYFNRKRNEWEKLPKHLIDTHCHFDMLFPKIKFENSVENYFKKYHDYYFENFEACINVMCDPYRFYPRAKFNSYLKTINHSKVYSSIGCHPHFSDYWNEELENFIYLCISNARIIAIGECGLDIGKKNQIKLEIQRKCFKAQLKIANETDLPIVIHARETLDEVFELLKEHLKPTHRIHLHCFTGSWNCASKFLNFFENLCIGVTPLTTYKVLNNQFKEFILKIPLDRLLLETDSPYFTPQTMDFPQDIVYSHPGFVFTTAESVAEYKKVSLSVLINATRSNVKKVYGI